MSLLIRLVKQPALLLTFALFCIAQSDQASEFVRQNDIAWNIYICLTGLILYVQTKLPWNFSGIVGIGLQFIVQYALFTIVFWLAKQATRPVRWLIWIVFFTASFLLYWINNSPAGAG